MSVLPWEVISGIRVLATWRDFRGLVIVSGDDEITVWAVKPWLNFWDRGARARELAKDFEGRLHSMKGSD